jgi:hypothetical protein
MEKKEQRFVVKFVWLKGWGSKKRHEELMSTLRDDASGLSEIKIWLQPFRTGDLSRSDLIRAGRPPLTLGPHVEVFLQKYLFVNAWIIAKHFLATASTVEEIHQGELRMRKFSRRWVLHSLSDAQKTARFETVKNVKDFARIKNE